MSPKPKTSGGSLNCPTILINSAVFYPHLPNINLKPNKNANHIQPYYSTFNTFAAAVPKSFEKLPKTMKTTDGDITFDFSKNLVNETVLKELFALARSRNVEGLRDAMFSGQPINFAENRAVLHIALRNRSKKPIQVNGKDVARQRRRLII